MSNVLIGGVPGFYIYFCRNSTFKAGDPSSDKHQPFNPITENTGIKMPEQVYRLIAPVSNLYPTIEVDEKLEPSTITFRCYFREPFLMLTMFTHKEMPSSWTETSDTITANFSTINDIDNNIAVQLYLPDPSGSAKHVALLFDGGRIVEYRLVGIAQGAVIEEIDIKFAEITVNTQDAVMDSGFHDASFGTNKGWALWNINLFATKNIVLLTKDVTITVGGSGLDGLAVQSWTLTLPVPTAMEHVYSSLVAGIIHQELQGPWSFELRGKLSGNDNIAEVLKTIANKTKSTVKLLYDASPLDKFFQFTNAVLKNIPGLSIPEAGKSIDVSYVYEGAGSSVLTYKWIGTEGTDPQLHIEHTDI